PLSPKEARMKALIHPSRSVKVILFVLLALALAAIVLPRTELYWEWKLEGKSKSRNSIVHATVVNASPIRPVSVPAAASSGFTPQIRVGFTEPENDEWEPAIASDRFGHVYILYPQYGGVPGCPGCYSPTMILQISSDHGQTFAS